MLERKEQKLVITLENINQADAIALKKMFGYMEYLGQIGSSRLCTFFADGDGSFHPKVSFDYPEELLEVPEIDGIITYEDIKKAKELNRNVIAEPSEGDFAIDSDSIAWKIYH
jgi:hypothetical protein